MLLLILFARLLVRVFYAIIQIVFDYGVHLYDLCTF